MPQPPQPESPRRSRNAGGPVAALVVVLLLAAYPFSLGPVVWLLDRTQPNDRIMVCAEAFYWPVLAVSEAVPPVGELVEGYIDWWSAATPAPANAPLPAPPLIPPPMPATTVTIDANGVERIGVDFTP